MFDFFEQPYTLIGAAVLVLFAILTFRSVVPEKRRWWQLLVPPLIALAAFGLDVLVETDLEKVNAVIDAGVKAVADEDCDAISRLVLESYSDSYHSTKQRLLAHCRRTLSQNLVLKNKKTGVLIELSGSDATAVVFMTMIFDKSSFVAQNFKSFLLVKARLNLYKQPDEQWLISRVEILELDRQPVNWGHIR